MKVLIPLLGRPSTPWLLGAAWLVAVICYLALWTVAIPLPSVVGGAGIPMQTVVALAFFLIGVWSVVPPMPSWQALSLRKERRARAVAAGIVVVSAVGVHLAGTVALQFIPAARLANSQGYDVDVFLSARWVIACNVLTVCACSVASICAFGRIVGTFSAGLLLVALTGLGAWRPIRDVVPFFVNMPGAEFRTHWPTAVALLVGAIALWWRTGGTTALSRWLDPRDLRRSSRFG